MGVAVIPKALFPDLRAVFSVDLRGLALFRIALGLILIADLLIRAPDLILWLSDDGLTPREWIIQWNNEWRFSLYFIHGHWLWAVLLNCVAALSAVALILGYRTRLSTLASFVLLGSLHFRAPMLLQGGDILLVAMLFWSIFLPMGARYSIDATLVRDRGQEAAINKCRLAKVPKRTFERRQRRYFASGHGRILFFRMAKNRSRMATGWNGYLLRLASRRHQYLVCPAVARLAQPHGTANSLCMVARVCWAGADFFPLAQSYVSLFGGSSFCKFRGGVSTQP